MRDLFLLLAILPATWLVCMGIAAALHWLAHRGHMGEVVTWRRSYDKVLMVARRCPICGKLTGMRPSWRSYKHTVDSKRG